jgi:hypothetical protein
MVGTQVDENPASINSDVAGATEIYTSDVEGTPDFNTGQGVKFLDGTLAGPDFLRRSLVGERVQGSGTPDREFLQTIDPPDTLTFQTLLMGSNFDTPVGDGDLDLPPAIRMLFEGLGVIKTSGDISETLYNTGKPTYLSLSRLSGDDSHLIRIKYGSCLVQSCAIAFAPAQPAIATWTVIPGNVNSRQEGGSFPDFPNLAPPANAVGGYGKMDTAAPPVFIGAAMMVGGVARNPNELTLTITQGIDPVGNGNNAINGRDLFPNNQLDVSLTGNLMLDTNDISQEWDDANLVLQQDDYIFTLGTVATNKLRFTLSNATLDSSEPIRLGDQYAQSIAIHPTAINNVAGTHLEIQSS